MFLLIVLIAALFVTALITKLIRKQYYWSLSGRVAMSVMLLITATGHFLYTKGMIMMLPEFIPLKEQVVFITGILEIAFAIGFLIPSLRKLTAWLLIIFFILILPANIHAALNKVNYQEATFSGPGTGYLWMRVPLQIIFIIWTWFFGIKLK